MHTNSDVNVDKLKLLFYQRRKLFNKKEESFLFKVKKLKNESQIVFQKVNDTEC